MYRHLFRPLCAGDTNMARLASHSCVAVAETLRSPTEFSQRENFYPVLLSTGPVLLQQRGPSLLNPTEWPHVLWMKLGLVGALLLLTATHDLLLGPQVRKISALPEGVRSFWERTIVRTSSWVPRIALLLALFVLGAAIMLARS